MTPLADRLLDVLLVGAAAAVHVWAARRADALPPDGVFEAVVLGAPLLADLAAAALLLRATAAVCRSPARSAWLLVLFALPSGQNGLRFVPVAVLLSVALVRPRLVSSDRADAG